MVASIKVGKRREAALGGKESCEGNGLDVQRCHGAVKKRRLKGADVSGGAEKLGGPNCGSSGKGENILGRNKVKSGRQRKSGMQHPKDMPSARGSIGIGDPGIG
ncbi:hypothetical protein IV203_025327 [Nitzschia inconspicua]|uniref:Uncharacterized protein n=1 Tax=Nitzschia inconspicua TaxID=303405 RepID=A0A9K3PWN7_9STRA|nr:hypothetical protein IV203_024669 [Nitzschia inconspicua]KAG7362443.1 hypothetical protein IV203_025327 [Nitzschia inconspicua]